MGAKSPMKVTVAVEPEAVRRVLSGVGSEQILIAMAMVGLRPTRVKTPLGDNSHSAFTIASVIVQAYPTGTLS